MTPTEQLNRAAETLRAVVDRLTSTEPTDHA